MSTKDRIVRLEAREPQPPTPPTEADRERVLDRLTSRIDGIASRLGPHLTPGPEETQRTLAGLRTFVAERVRLMTARAPGPPPSA